MAKTYYAATRIKHGSRVEDGSQDGKVEEKTFSVGDKVTGLSPEDMKDLWNAGALTDQAPERSDEEEQAETTSGSKPDETKPDPSKPNTSTSTKAQKP